jgi:hypothetical protein
MAKEKSPKAPSQTTEQKSTFEQEMFDIKVFEARLLKSEKMKNITDFLYNEAVLKRLILKAEIMKESYAIGRLSLLGSAANKPLKTGTEDAEVISGVAKESISEAAPYYRSNKQDDALL